ncbi:Flagellin (plasmid) [Paraburkholderia dioscoreae]|uniref:Flagellin n=1 Tax=Paraburkholderia dioscoreae TaxID=2604047 RepID=A0A5Q4ZEP8_9BURK|nr:Flagellin [Paraburkholderia dioscoreae]
MLGINSNINSLVAQQNLAGSQSALSQAITRLSSGKRINSAADDAAGLAISTGMQSQINGLNQGVSNANDGVSMIQTASSGLAQITSSLQRIRQLAVQASNGGLTADNQAALQQEVSQQIAEVNRIASQTTYNGKNVLDGSAGNVSFQVGANVGQTINLNLTQNVSSTALGKGLVGAGTSLGTIANVNVDSATGGTYNAQTSTGYQVTSINVLSDGKGGFTYTDQNNQALTSTATKALFGNSTGVGGSLNITTNASGTSALDVTNQVSAISSANNVTNYPVGTGTTIGTITGISIDAKTGADVAAGTAGAITSITVKTDGSGGFTFADQSGNALASGLVGNTTTAGSLFTITAGTGGAGNKLALTSSTAQATAISLASSGATFGSISAGSTIGTLTGLSLDPNSGAAVAAGSAGAITSITVQEGTAGHLNFLDQNGNAISSSLVGAAGSLITVTAGDGSTTNDSFVFAGTAPTSSPALAAFAQIDSNNNPGTVANINISTTTGANSAIESIDNALNTVNNIQATLGAAQNRFTAISTTQQAESTDLSQAQSNITDANFAQETANLSKAQVLQQAGISVLAQANSLPQQVLKLLQ